MGQEPIFIKIKGFRSFMENVSVIAAALYVMFLPFDQLYATVCLFLLAFSALVPVNLTKLKSIPRAAWIFLALYFLTLSGYFYSVDKWRAGYLLERQLSFLLFPVLLPLALRINGRMINFILWCFTLSCVFTLAYLFFFCFEFLYWAEVPLKFLLHPRFFNHSFTTPIGTHAGYISLYVSLCVLFLVRQMICSGWMGRIMISLLILFFATGLFFLASRNAIVTTGFVLLFVLPFYVPKRKLLFFFINMALISIVLFFASRSRYIYERFSSQLVEDLHINYNAPGEGDEPRIRRWQCAFDLIEKRPWFGYGSGDEIGLLKDEYLKNNMELSYYEEFNTHNQYIAYLLKHGIFGLAVFLSILTCFFYIAIRAKDFLYLSFLIVLTAGLFTENILDAQKGIFYVAFFNTLLGYRILLSKKTSSELPLLQQT